MYEKLVLFGSGKSHLSTGCPCSATFLYYAVLARQSFGLLTVFRLIACVVSQSLLSIFYLFRNHFILFYVLWFINLFLGSKPSYLNTDTAMTWIDTEFLFHTWTKFSIMLFLCLYPVLYKSRYLICPFSCYFFPKITRKRHRK